jgi:hypothetical protein
VIGYLAAVEYVAISEWFIVITLALIAVVLAGIELVRSKGQNLTAWAVALLAVAVIVERL